MVKKLFILSEENEIKLKELARKNNISQTAVINALLASVEIDSDITIQKNVTYNIKA